MQFIGDKNPMKQNEQLRSAQISWLKFYFYASFKEVDVECLNRIRNFTEFESELNLSILQSKKIKHSTLKRRTSRKHLNSTIKPMKENNKHVSAQKIKLKIMLLQEFLASGL